MKTRPSSKMATRSRAGADVARQHIQQATRKKLRPKRDMVFAQWIAQFDRALLEQQSPCAGSTSKSATSESPRPDQALPQRGLEIVAAIGLATAG